MAPQGEEPHCRYILLPADLIGRLHWEEVAKEISNEEWEEVSQKAKEEVSEVSFLKKRKQHSSTIAERLQDFMKAGAYVTTMFQSVHSPGVGLESSLSLWRLYNKLHLKDSSSGVHPMFKEAIAQTNNLRNSSLLLFGSSKSGWHRDWAEARNVAFAMDGSDPSSPLSLWAFIPPGSEAWINECQEREWSKPFTHAHRLTSKHLKDLAQMTHDGKAIIYLVPQSHGQMMIVLAGWVHCVTNLRMCGKLAWNFYKPTNMAQYFEAAQQRRESFGSSNAPGYVWNGAVLISCISLIASEIR